MVQSCCINASTLTTLVVWEGVESVVSKAISLLHTTTPLCIGWCGVVCVACEILGVVNISSERGVVSWQRR